MSARAKCPRCGALLMADAKWCPQCFMTFGRRSRAERKAPPAPPNPDDALIAQLEEMVRSDEGAAVVPPVAQQLKPRGGPVGWPCPVCQFLNPLDRTTCQVCRTPFSQLFEQKRQVREDDPRRAVRRSLLFPGLGHARVGKVGEGICRAVLFAWALASAIAMAMLHPSSGTGPLGLLAGLFLSAAIAVYVLSAIDAGRVARGAEQLLSLRMLFYGFAGLVLLSVMWLFVLVFHATGATHSLTPSS